MKPAWKMVSLVICCAIFTVYISFGQTGSVNGLLIIPDALNPMAELLKHKGYDVQALNPYELSARLPGLDGMALVYETQARACPENTDAAGFIPLHSAAVVIAVNRSRQAEHSIEGWLSLIESNMVVCIPHYNTEGGRLAAIALARGLGAGEGDIEPATEAYARLKSENRINDGMVYYSGNFLFMYDIQQLQNFDAVILWDYQAHALREISRDWEIIVPGEGVLTVNCGLLYSGQWYKKGELPEIKKFLTSEQGLLAMEAAGFAPVAEQTDLAAWDTAKLLFGPAFRREVLEQKLFSPASVLERLIVQSIILVLFCIAAQLILHRFPGGVYRNSSLYTLAFILFWMLMWIIKGLSYNDEITRYLWLASYIPRHALPLCWYVMCHVDRFGRLPSQQKTGILITAAVILSAVALTNDLHNWFFVYQSDIRANWDNHYTYNWGYYLSALGTVSLIAGGITHLGFKRKTMQQKRQLLFAVCLTASLLAYQFSYVAGVKYVVEFDIPTTVAVIILLFMLAAQRERFMGSSLLALPVFHNSPYAIAVFDSAKKMAYHNAAMSEIMRNNAGTVMLKTGQDDDSSEILAQDRAYSLQKYTMGNGQALVLQDITHLKKMEEELNLTRRKLSAVRELLSQQSQGARSLAEKTEQEYYLLQMNRLFTDKVKEIQKCLSQKQEAIAGSEDYSLLQHIRLLIYICQHRLRFMIRGADTPVLIPSKRIEDYLCGIIRDAGRIGLDAVVTAAVSGSCPTGIAFLLLEAIDVIILGAKRSPASSLVCRIEADEYGILFTAVMSYEVLAAARTEQLLPEKFFELIFLAGGSAVQQFEDDCTVVRISFDYQEAPV